MTYTEIIKTYFSGITVHERSSNLILCRVPAEKLLETCRHFYKTHKLSLKTIKAVDTRSVDGEFKIFYIFGIAQEEYFPTVVVSVGDTNSFPSITEEIFQAVHYEAEIASFFGLTPIDHAHLQPFILHENWPSTVYPLRKDVDWNIRPAQADSPPYSFQEIQGEGIYEIPVGPVHAGIIEPGHFRFSVVGEEIVYLEPKLGYVHKGSEKLFEVLSLPDKLKLSERISGDSSFSHAVAFCQAIETISDIQVPKRAEYIRVIFAELERIANHLNDAGFILNDTAFSFGGSNGQRLKEQVMQLNEKLSGHRFFRGAAVVGGVAMDISQELQELIKSELAAIETDFSEVVAIAEDSETVINRLKKTGVLEKKIALDYGVVGVAARASGISVDARLDHPYGAYKELSLQVVQQQSADVYARYAVRIEEVFTSINLIFKALEKLKQKGAIHAELKRMKKSSYAVGIVEGWRGEIVYFISTDAQGAIDRVGVRDPSFLNWSAVPHTVVGNIVPDFPLINKSFNLSYSGFDR